MEIHNIKVSEIKPYKRNPRNNDQAVDAVVESIKSFGFKVPIVLDRNNVIIAGHTRVKAAKRLGLDVVPCVIADDLSDEQARAFRIADNKVAELADWDYTLLDEEINELFNFNFEDFGFEFSEVLSKEENAEDTQERVQNILNLGKAIYTGSGKYDIPQIVPVTELPPISEWIGFNYVLTDKEPEEKAVHFFVDDYQFERIWNDPDKYIDKLRRYAAVATPDFSPYGDMPMATQIYNHYRKHWVGRYLQDAGVRVIPTIRASTDPRSLEWYLDGEPQGGICLISSMWATQSEDLMAKFREEYIRMYAALHPSKVFVYGREVIDLPGNIEYIKTFTQQRWGK